MALPKTKARLQSSITIHALSGDNIDYDHPENWGKMTKIGAIKSVKVNQTRTISVWRELDNEVDNPGRIVEAYPSLPTYELTLEKTVLYKENLLQAFGYGEGMDLLEQTAPLLIAVTLRNPDEANIPVKVVYYTHVWFESNPMDFDVEATDLRITQTVKATVGRVIVHKLTA